MVGREEIQNKVRKIMVDKEGHGIRDRVNELKYSAEKALCKGGSSYRALSELAKSFEAHMQLQNKKAPLPITYERSCFLGLG